jgi:hypothetical protein
MDKETQNRLFLNKSIEYNTPYGTVYINYEAENISVKLSGGFDSALLLYMVAKTANEHNSSTVIRPITIRKGNPTEFKQYDGFDTYEYTDKIIKWVRECFPQIKIEDSVKHDANYWWITQEQNGRPIGSYTYTQQLLTEFMYWKYVLLSKNRNKLLYAEYVGITKNPSDNNFPKSTETHREKTVKGAVTPQSLTIIDYDTDRAYIEPFRNGDKRVTFWLANNFSIMDTLLNITRSCEGDYIDTENFTKECGTCWWCLERDWGHKNFNKYE